MQGSFYLYTEASPTDARQKDAILNFRTPISTGSTLQFGYHMYGSDMGSLQVETQQGSTWNTVWVKSGQQQSAHDAAWKLAIVTIKSTTTSASVLTRIRAVTGSSYRSDIAIDGLTVISPTGPEPAPEPEPFAKCVEDDECASTPCLNGASCTDKVANFTCACRLGFTGVYCAVDVDECSSKPCSNGGTCTHGANSFSCRCTSDWTGTTCGTKRPPKPPPPPPPNCYAGDATVQLRNGRYKRMDELQVGDIILSSLAERHYETVLGFSHSHRTVWANFVDITTSHNNTISVTAEHYIYADGTLTLVADIQVGDYVNDGDVVTAVGESWKYGTFVPVTWSGDLVVSGVQASIYGPSMPVLVQSVFGVPYVGLRYLAGVPVVNAWTV
eukprot:COSAG05_NODE_1253_length_5369_cov_14.480674_4_plen_385_part_00